MTKRMLAWTRGIAIALLPLAATACTTGPKDYLEYRSRSDPASVIRRIADQIGTCWFADGETAFANLIYTPERNAGISRVLLVEKGAPGGLPQLVITAAKDGRKTSVRLFGPLLASSQGKRIEADVNRWAGGTSGCG